MGSLDKFAIRVTTSPQALLDIESALSHFYSQHTQQETGPNPRRKRPRVHRAWPTYLDSAWDRPPSSRAAAYGGVAGRLLALDDPEMAGGLAVPVLLGVEEEEVLVGRHGPEVRRAVGLGVVDNVALLNHRL